MEREKAYGILLAQDQENFLLQIFHTWGQLRYCEQHVEIMFHFSYRNRWTCRNNVSLFCKKNVCVTQTYLRSRIGSIVWPPQICPHPIRRQCFSTRLDKAIFSSISVQTGFVKLIFAKSARVASTLPPVLNDPIFTNNTSPLDSFGT